MLSRFEKLDKNKVVIKFYFISTMPINLQLQVHD